MNTKKYTGSCHCQAIKFEFTESDKISTGLRCNCSICQRKGYVMSSFVVSPDEIKITDESNNLTMYQFGDKTAKHYFCQKCGIHPFHQTFRQPNHYRINLGCIQNIDMEKLTIKVFNGKEL
ncbi:MAG: GFA family protein [Gammaproteobacteria bacterium]|nr:MAG: GFA family protein [Gammaproteobacteria bacterium]